MRAIAEASAIVIIAYAICAAMVWASHRIGSYADRRAELHRLKDLLGTEAGARALQSILERRRADAPRERQP